MTYKKLGLALTASSLLLAGCISPAPDLTPAEEQARTDLDSSNYQPAPRELRDNIETQEILAQAAFWSHEYNLNPTDLESAIKFAAVLRKLGNPNRAVEVTQTTRAIYPRNPYLNAEYAAALLADQKPRPALRVIDSSLKETPAYGRLWSLKGVALDQMEKYAQARPFYERALRITPNDPNIMANMGLNFALSGDPHTAKTWLTRASQHPDASDSVFANLELVENLVAEAGPTPSAQNPSGLRQSYQAPAAPTSGRSYPPHPARPQYQAAPSAPSAQTSTPRQYGAYAAGPQTSPAARQTKPQAYTQNLRRGASAQGTPQTSQLAGGVRHNQTAPNLGGEALKGGGPIATNRDVLARIAENVKLKTPQRQAPRGYRLPAPQRAGGYPPPQPRQTGDYSNPPRPNQGYQNQGNQNRGYQNPGQPYQGQPNQGYQSQGYQAATRQDYPPQGYTVAQPQPRNQATQNNRAPQIRGGYPPAQYNQQPTAQPYYNPQVGPAQNQGQRRRPARRRG